jgi:hypothetical protein
LFWYFLFFSFGRNQRILRILVIHENFSIWSTIHVCVAHRALDRGFESWLGQTKDYEICICCLSAKQAALKRKSNDWLTRNQDMCPRRAICGQNLVVWLNQRKSRNHYSMNENEFTINYVFNLIIYRKNTSKEHTFLYIFILFFWEESMNFKNLS